MAGFAFDDGLRATLAERVAGFPRRAYEDASLRSAAVAVAVVDDGGQGAVLLTVRATTPDHPGQFALPGGGLAAGESAEAAALRELAEELGVHATSDQVLGLLDDFATVSGFVITPVVVWVGEAELRPDPREVAAAHRVPFSDLDADGIPRITRNPRVDGPVLEVPLRSLSTWVYAPTGAILYQFREVALRGEHTRVDHFMEPPFAWG